MSIAQAIRLILSHTGSAAAMALVFAAGGVFAFQARRWRLRALKGFAEWFAGRVERILSSGPSRLRLAAFIFLFNASAIFLYMLTGLVPWLPILTTFLAGMNVIFASLAGRGRDRGFRTKPHVARSARICMLLTFALELPAFWYAMAMGWTIRTRMMDLFWGTNLDSVRDRAAAYAMILVPILFVSAIAEAHAIVSSLEPAE